MIFSTTTLPSLSLATKTHMVFFDFFIYLEMNFLLQSLKPEELPYHEYEAEEQSSTSKQQKK